MASDGQSTTQKIHFSIEILLQKMAEKSKAGLSPCSALLCADFPRYSIELLILLLCDLVEYHKSNEEDTHAKGQKPPAFKRDSDDFSQCCFLYHDILLILHTEGPSRGEDLLQERFRSGLTRWLQERTAGDDSACLPRFRPSALHVKTSGMQICQRLR